MGKRRRNGEPHTCSAEGTMATATGTDSLYVAGKKNSRELTLGSDIPTFQPISWENHYSKSHMHPKRSLSTTYRSRTQTP